MPRLKIRAIRYRQTDGSTKKESYAILNNLISFRKLLEYGAQVDTESKAGFAPIHLASQERYLTVRHYISIFIIKQL